jgi:hypothetical protein
MNSINGRDACDDFSMPFYEIVAIKKCPLQLTTKAK